MTTPRPYQVRRLPSWLYFALNLVRTDVPSDLLSRRDDEGVFIPMRSVIDLFQGGLAENLLITVDSTINPGEILNLTDGTTGSAAFNSPATPLWGFLVLAMSYKAIGFAATRNPVFAIQPQMLFSVDVGIRVAETAVAAGTFAAWQSIITKANKTYFCPPGFNPIVYANDLGAGESLEVFASVLRIPAGYKPF